jgi:hypothetical protein
MIEPTYPLKIFTYAGIRDWVLNSLAMLNKKNIECSYYPHPNINNIHVCSLHLILSLLHSLIHSHTACQAARDQAQEESAQKSREISRLEGEVASHSQTIAECKARIRDDEMVRRKLHNTIQELKGMNSIYISYIVVPGSYQ